MSHQVTTFTPDGKQSRAERRRRKQLRTTAERAGQTVTPRAAPLPASPVGADRYGSGLQRRAYWNPARLIAQPIKAASGDVAGIYPFIADGGTGHRGPMLGLDITSDNLFHFSPWDAVADGLAFSTNVLITGAFHSGKSATAKMMALRSLAFGHQSVIPSDSKGEWVRLASAVAGDVHRIGDGRTRINPLQGGARRTGSSDEDYEATVRDRRRAVLATISELVAGTTLTAIEHAALAWALDRAAAGTNGHPTIRTVWNHLAHPTAADRADRPDLLEAASGPRFVLERMVSGDLAGLFEDESTIAFNEAAPMVVVDTSILFERSELAAMVAQACTNAWIQSAIADTAARRTRYVIKEEGWRDMASIAALQHEQQRLKLSRHYGIANIYLLHKTGDFDAVGPAGSKERALAYSLLADMENKFVFRQNTQEKDALVSRLRMPRSHADLATTLAKGQYLAYIGMRSFLVDAFATSTALERALVRTDQAVVDALDAFEHTTCSTCGADLQAEWKFCITCGTPTPASAW